jgi:hypothetical protein
MTAGLASGCQQGFDRGLHFADFDAAIAEFRRLALAPKLVSHHAGGGNGWSLSEIAEHCAQSIEYSLLGFPQEYSNLFQHTVGSAAFAAFKAMGKMTHNTKEAIPGAPLLSDAALEVNLNRLLSASARLQAKNAVLRNHFAYGALSQADMVTANLMHIANHLSKIEA